MVLSLTAFIILTTCLESGVNFECCIIGMYMDRRCVYYQKPLLESGTLGTKGNTQVCKKDPIFFRLVIMMFISMNLNTLYLNGLLVFVEA